jgi:hypothetical protein
MGAWTVIGSQWPSACLRGSIAMMFYQGTSLEIHDFDS